MTQETGTKTEKNKENLHFNSEGRTEDGSLAVDRVVRGQPESLEGKGGYSTNRTDGSPVLDQIERGCTLLTFGR